jgi:hypothetical protein
MKNEQKCYPADGEKSSPLGLLLRCKNLDFVSQSVS